MTTLIVFSDANDGEITSNDPSDTLSREGTGAGCIASTAVLLHSVGQQLLAGPQYYCYESFVSFDTSSILDVTVQGAVLSLFIDLAADKSVTDFTIEARVKDWGATLTAADWVAGTALGSPTLVASLVTSALTLGVYSDLTDVALPANVNLGGATRLMFNSDRHRLAQVQTGNEYVQPYAADAPGTINDPKITITYTDNRRAFISGDRTKETTTTTGTGTVTLAGAVSGYRAFSSVAVTGDVVAYAIVGTTEWEVGIGSWHTGNLLYRDKVLASSNSGALVSFSAGSKDVFNTLPAGHGILPTASRVQTQDVLIPRNTSVYVAGDYEVVAGKTLELGVNAYMEIG